MPRPRLPYLVKEVSRHGLTTWYVRKGKGPRVRVRGEFGTEEFRANYRAALAEIETAKIESKTAATGSLAWLVDRYLDSPEWAALKQGTRDQRASHYRQIVETAGQFRAADITTEIIAAGRARRAATPFAATDFVKAMRGLFKWAAGRGLVPVDPTIGVRGVPTPTTGHRPWTDEEVAQFESRWPVGTRERLALVILLLTGLRRGDAARLGRAHCRDGMIRLETEKTGMIVTIPVLPELAWTLFETGGKLGRKTFVARLDGAPMVKEGFGNWFADACTAAGVKGRAHGLRKAGATRAANNGATEAELEALFGWTGGRMASLYTRTANREKLARGAIGKLARGDS
jgi:integrase